MKNTLTYIEATTEINKKSIIAALREDVLHLMNYIRKNSELPKDFWDDLDDVSESIKGEFSEVDDIIEMLDDTENIIDIVIDLSNEEYHVLRKSIRENTSYLDFTYDRLVAQGNLEEQLDNKYEGILISPELLMYELIEDRTACYRLAEDLAQVRSSEKAKYKLGEDIYKVLGAVELILKTRLGLDHTLDYTSKEVLEIVRESKGNIDTFDPYITVHGSKY